MAVRLLYISSSRIPSRDANSIHTMQMCNSFSSMGLEVSLFCRKGTEQSLDIFLFYGVDHEFAIHPLPWPGKRFGSLIYGMNIFWRVAHQPKDNLLAYGRNPYGLLACSAAGIPTVLELHAPPNNTVRRFVEGLLISRPELKRVIVISNALKMRYLDLFEKLSCTDILVAPDAAPNHRSLLAPKAEPWPGRHSAIQVGYVGHVYPGKGAEVVVELAHRIPEIDFHIVGGLENDLPQTMRRKGLTNLFFHGFVDPATTGLYRERCHMLVLPVQKQVSVSTGKGDIGDWMSPLKLFEYMSSRRPIVASDLPVLREILDHEVNALLVPPEDLDAWESAVRLLGENPALRARLAKVAYGHFLEKYTWDARGRAVLRKLGLGLALAGFERNE